MTNESLKYSTPGGAVTYQVSLIDRRRNFRLTVKVDADSALEAIAKAKAWNSSYPEVESCSVLKFNF